MRSWGILQYSATATLTIALVALGGQWTARAAGKDQQPAAAKATPAARASVHLSDPNAIYGEPLAPGMVRLLQDEIATGLRKRGVDGDFARFQRYAGSRLDATAAAYTGSELAGNCRLSWYDHMLRNPLRGPGRGRGVHPRRCTRRSCDDPCGTGPACWPSRPRSWTSASASRARYVAVHSPHEALDVVKQALVEAQAAYAAALAPLTKGEIQELATYLYPVLVGQNRVGHTLNDRGTGRRLCDLMEKMDRGAMIDAAEALVPLSRSGAVATNSSNCPTDGDVRRAGRDGAGGGADRHARRRDRHRRQGAQYLPARRACATWPLVIDLGGGNTYYEGTVLARSAGAGGAQSRRRQCLPRPPAGRPGRRRSWASRCSSTSDGDNRYDAHDVAQGSAIGRRRHPRRVRRQQHAIAACAACRARPSAAWAS